MGKAYGEDETKGNPCASTARGGVTVTVYVESPSPLNRTKRKSSVNALTSTSRSSDRRAELLAYSKQMRTSSSQHSIHNSGFRPKSRAKWKWSLPLRKLQSAFSRILRKDNKDWRYERIETRGIGTRHKWCHPRSLTCNNAKRRMVCIFKKLWRGCCRWKCNKVRIHQ